ADAEDGHDLVADEPDDRGQHHGPQVRDGLRVEEAPPRLVAGDERARGDRHDDGDSGQVLDATEPVGEPAGRPPPSPPESPARRVSQKAMPSGIAVAASAKLWMVSARSATLPDRTTTATWRLAVTSRPMNDHLSAQSPRAVEAIDGSTTPWLCPCPCSCRPW